MLSYAMMLCSYYAVPVGTFAAKGSQAIPAQFADLVPAIAFQIPDIAAMATLQLQSKDTGARVACIQSSVSNGKTASVPAVSYVAAGVAGAALVMGGVSAVGAAFAGGGAAVGGSSTAGGMGTVSPSFTEVFGWFQGMAMNGMLSVNYPHVYRSFAKNFAFSTGLVPWDQLQRSIDGFRASTGGNLTQMNTDFLRNATLVYPDGSTTNLKAEVKVKRALEEFVVLARRQFQGIETSVNASAPAGGDAADAPESIRMAVSGIQGYVQTLSIPSANTFMTVLLIVAIAIVAIAVSILLVKLILEFWALFGSFPKSLAGFRKHYWGSIGRAITSLILLLYGVWVLYCVFQFTQGDSYVAKTLAGVTLALFTGILAFFCWKIWSTARRLKNIEGDITGLYEDKSIWVKYSLFYESYRKDYWWIFVPTIVYMFAKGVALAAGDGHGMAQTIAQLIIEGVMLVVLLWSRPFERKSSNVINVAIQVVRVLSVICILVFVEEFGIAQTTQTVTGVVLIAVQSALTGILAILIAWNAISACCKQNPHRKRRKEMGRFFHIHGFGPRRLTSTAEKMQQRDTLTPLDARNSLLLDRSKSAEVPPLPDSFSINKTGFAADTKSIPSTRGSSPEQLYSIGSDAEKRPGLNPLYGLPSGNPPAYRPITPSTPLSMGAGNSSRENLVLNAAPPPKLPDSRQPTLPNLGGYGPRPPQSSGGFSQGGYGDFGYGQPYGRSPPSRGGY